MKNQMKTIDTVRGMINYPPDALTGVYFGYNVDINSAIYKKAVECCRQRVHPPKLEIRRKNTGSFGAYWKGVVDKDISI